MQDHLPPADPVTLVLGPPAPERLLGLRQWALKADRRHPFSVLYLAPSAYLRERLLGVEIIAGRYYHLKDPLQHGKTNYLVRADQRASLGIGTMARQGILEGSALEGMLLNTASLAATAAERLRAGRFPPLPRDGERECPRCPYRAICRVDARKAGAWRGALEEAL